MQVHSAVGRRHGITNEEIEMLIVLDRSRFDQREWLALKYAQDWIACDGAEPAGDYMADFRRAYSGRERAYILKLVRMMRFANYWSNTFSGRPWRPEHAMQSACSIDTGDPGSA
ncbi:MAG: hypothetical protein JW807_09550 [Spirochaetes bacterium]|nr:hypothetical protein [Spirochaetota bacterium]